VRATYLYHFWAWGKRKFVLVAPFVRGVVIKLQERFEDVAVVFYLRLEHRAQLRRF